MTALPTFNLDAGINRIERRVVPTLVPVPKRPGIVYPTVSIVMPTFKRAHLIGESIRSLLDQSWKDFELLVRDDGPDDAVEKIVAQVQDPRIRYHRNATRLGMPTNLNEGIRDSVGEYVLVCHDHDLYNKAFVEKMARFLQDHPFAIFVHAGVEVIDQDGQPKGQRYVGNFPQLSPGRVWLNRMLSRLDCPVCADSMVRRSAYEKYGLYNPAFGFVSDVEMWMRLCLSGEVGYLAEPLIRVREREANHPSENHSWDLMGTVLEIQRMYHEKAFRGLYGWWRRLRFWAYGDGYLFTNYLACVARKDRLKKEQGRAYLRHCGFPFSRLAARVL